MSVTDTVVMWLQNDEILYSLTFEQSAEDIHDCILSALTGSPVQGMMEDILSQVDWREVAECMADDSEEDENEEDDE